MSAPHDYPQEDPFSLTESFCNLSSKVKSWEMILSFLALWLVNLAGSSWHLNMLEGIIFFYPTKDDGRDPNGPNKAYCMMTSITNALPSHKFGIKIPSIDTKEKEVGQADLPSKLSPITTHFVTHQQLIAFYKNIVLLFYSSLLAHVFSLGSHFLNCTESSQRTSSWASVFPSILAVFCIVGNIKCYSFLTRGQRIFSILMSSLVTAAVLQDIFTDVDLIKVFKIPKDAFNSYISLIYSSYFGPNSPLSSDSATQIQMFTFGVLIFSLTVGLLFISISTAKIFGSLMFASVSKGGISGFRKPLLLLDAIFPLFLSLVYNDSFWTGATDSETTTTTFLGVFHIETKYKIFFQIFSMLAWAMLHFSCLKPYLQKYLASSLEDSLSNSSDLKGEVSASSKSMIRFSFQFLSICLLPIGAAIVLHRYSYSLNSYAPTDSDEAAQTAILTSKPFLRDFGYALTQISSKENNWINVILGLLVKGANLYMPSSVAIPLLQSLISFYLKLWSFVFFSSQFFFTLFPSTAGGVGKQKAV